MYVCMCACVYCENFAVRKIKRNRTVFMNCFTLHGARRIKSYYDALAAV